MNSINPVMTYDFTIPSERVTQQQLKDFLKKYCRKWVFQLEKGEEGYEHYQGRLSLKVKERMKTLKDKWEYAEMDQVHLSHTSKENIDNEYYVTKEETRLEGPWSNIDVPMPQYLLDIEWRPWQDKVMAMKGDGRTVGCIVDVLGGIGKSTIVSYMCRSGKAMKIPSTIEKANEMMGFVMSFNEYPMYFIDIPRALAGRALKELFAAIEEITGGYCYDTRYHGKVRWMEGRPFIWVFMNSMPDLTLLTKNRWKIMGVDGANDLYELQY